MNTVEWARRKGEIYVVLGHVLCTTHGSELEARRGEPLRCPVAECPVEVVEQ